MNIYRKGRVLNVKMHCQLLLRNFQTCLISLEIYHHLSNHKNRNHAKMCEHYESPFWKVEAMEKKLINILCAKFSYFKIIIFWTYIT